MMESNFTWMGTRGRFGITYRNPACLSNFVQPVIPVSCIIEPLLVACMRYSAAISLALLASLAGMAQELDQHTIKSNVEYRLSQGDLPKLTFGIEKPKNVEVTDGSEELLQDCLNDPVTWSQDPLVFRLAHTHAASIQSCRENRSPSMHVIFRRVADEPLQAWVHFDGHGSQTSESRLAHLGEFLYHKITFQNNDQDRMYENLQRSFSSPLGISPDPAIPFTLRERLAIFTDKTVTEVQPYAATLFSSATLLFISPDHVWGRGADNYTNHLVSSFTRRLVTYGIQSGAAAALHEDLRYKPSLSHNVWKRAGHALASTLILETPRGNDIAFANIVAAVGSAEIINASRPGQENPTQENLGHRGVWNLAGANLLGFAEGNLWNEFKPDIKHLVRSRLLHR